MKIGQITIVALGLVSVFTAVALAQEVKERCSTSPRVCGTVVVPECGGELGPCYGTACPYAVYCSAIGGTSYYCSQWAEFTCCTEYYMSGGCDELGECVGVPVPTGDCIGSKACEKCSAP